jgi:Bacterial membrane protein YfhO
MPRAYVVPTAAISSEDGSNPRARFLDADPKQSVLMNLDPLNHDPDRPRQPFTPAHWVSIDPDHPVMTVTTHGPGLLVVGDTWMPGWTARVDGKRAPIYRGNLAQRVIPLWQPGRHTIEMDYVPPGLVLGFIVTALSLLTWGFTCLVALAAPRTTSAEDCPRQDGPTRFPHLHLSRRPRRILTHVWKRLR